MAVAFVGAACVNPNMVSWEEQLKGDAAGPLPAVYDPARPEPAESSSGRARDVSTSAQSEWAQWWWYARRAARLFAQGVEPPSVDVYGPVLAADERGLLQADMTYSRLYAAGDGGYQKNGMFVVARPAVMVGALAVNAAINHRRKVAARRDAEQRWRDQQQIQVTVTTYRLLCNTLDKGFESFSYGAVTEFYPDLDGWELTLAFDGNCAPLRLSGPAAPILCLWTATAVLGDRWMTDPRLAKLVG